MRASPHLPIASVSDFVPILQNANTTNKLVVIFALGEPTKQTHMNWMRCTCISILQFPMVRSSIKTFAWTQIITQSELFSTQWNPKPLWNIWIVSQLEKMNKNETVSDLRLELKWNIDTLLKAFVSWAPEGKTCFLVFYFKSCPSQFHALLVFTWIEPFLQTFVGYKETLLLLKFHDITKSFH